MTQESALAQPIALILTLRQPKRGFEWSHFKVLHQEVNSDGSKKGDPKVECLHCKHVFFGGATRLRSHLLRTKKGVAACESISEEDKQAIEKVAAEKASVQSAKRAILAF